MRKAEKELCQMFCQCRKCRLFGDCPNFGAKLTDEIIKKILSEGTLIQEFDKHFSSSSVNQK